MTTKHISGPWHIGKRYPSGAIYDEKGGEICGFSNLLHPAEIAANARLIAAAPDLLSALRALVHPMANDDDVNHARAVIAKAEGD